MTSEMPQSCPALDLARNLLHTPRESGTESAREARDRIAAFLSQLGYQVETQRFSFSTSALLGLPVFGAGLGWLALLEIPLLVLPGAPNWAAAVIWVLGIVALIAIAVGLGLGWSTLGGETREDANLIATRGATVRCWIVAHYDTKAQGHSMAGRLVAFWVAMVASLFMTGLTIARLGGALSAGLMAAGTALAIVASFLAGRGRLRGKSPGARDNGSGLLAALVAAQENKDPSVGILVTGAEEFGLIGARYFAEQDPDRLRGAVVINFDTIDEQGAWRLVTHASNGEKIIRRVEAIVSASSPVPVRRHRLPMGIFVDSLPLSRAGAAAITIARLDWGTLKKIHTPADTLDGLSLESAVAAGGLAGKIFGD
jgi:hypothetical protein